MQDGTSHIGEDARAAADRDREARDEKIKVVLENDRIRVVDYRDKPGDKTKQHHHRPFMLYVLSPFKRRLTFPDGTVKEREFKVGEALWMEEQVHIGHNIGTTESHALLVEPKPAK